MKSHLLTFLLLAFFELCAVGGAVFAGVRWLTMAKQQQQQTSLMMAAYNAFVADQRQLAGQAAEGTAYREYRTQWEARLREYDTPSKVVEIMNAEASRAGVMPPRLNQTKSGPAAVDLSVVGRVNELNRWLTSVETRIDTLAIDELVLSSQMDTTLSMGIRGRVLGMPDVKPSDAPVALPQDRRQRPAVTPAVKTK